MNFFCSPSPTKRSTKSPRKIRGKFGAKFGAICPRQNSGRKFGKFGKLSFCNFPDLTKTRMTNFIGQGGGGGDSGGESLSKLGACVLYRSPRDCNGCGFLFVVGSFLLTVELLCLQLCCGGRI